MTSHTDPEALARQPQEEAALEVRLTDLRSRGHTILECIKYVKLNQGCSLAEAMDIVVNSCAWADRKDEFLRHQEEMFEEFLAGNTGMIEAIHQTITPDGTAFVVRLKAPAEPRRDTDEQDAGTDGGGMSAFPGS